MEKDEKQEKVIAKYTPMKPVEPTDFKVEEYLFDTNQLLFEINNKLNVIIDILSSNNTKEKQVRTIGVTSR